jgi:hypothetical protein
MFKLRVPLIWALIFLPAVPAASPLNHWLTLHSDVKGAVRDLLVSEGDKREGFSSPRQEQDLVFENIRVGR